MWTNNEGTEFASKVDAFEWLNSQMDFLDMPKLYCKEELRYNKTPFGIFDCFFQCYIKGDLPIERYL